MWTVESEVKNAIEELNLSRKDLLRLDETESTQIVTIAMQKYVEGNPRSWWLKLKKEYERFEYDDFPSDHLIEHIPKNQHKFYWIPETGKPNLTVYEATISGIQAILDKTAAFEYYVLGKNIDWLIIENDHNDLIVVRN